jgi:hypothetical protein
MLKFLIVILAAVSFSGCAHYNNCHTKYLYGSKMMVCDEGSYPIQERTFPRDRH